MTTTPQQAAELTAIEKIALEKYPVKPFYLRGENYAPSDLNENNRQAFIDGYNHFKSEGEQEAVSLIVFMQKVEYGDQMNHEHCFYKNEYVTAKFIYTQYKNRKG